jgi:hypothetical protein
MSHQVQLSPAASHCPTALLDPAGHAAEATGLPQPIAVLSGRTCAGYCHTLEIRSGRPSFTPPPKIPGRARDRYGSRTGPRGPATIPPRSAGRPDSCDEGSGARTPRVTGGPHYMPGHPGSDLPARLMTALDLPGTPELPAIDLPQTRAATGRRPAPTTTPAHPILPKVVCSFAVCPCPAAHSHSPRHGHRCLVTGSGLDQVTVDTLVTMNIASSRAGFCAGLLAAFGDTAAQFVMGG